MLRYLGTAVNQSADIAKKVKEDTGITIEYIPVTTDDVTQARDHAAELLRHASTPNTSRSRSWSRPATCWRWTAARSRTTTRSRRSSPRAQLPSGKVIGDQGTAPKKVMFLEGENSTKFATTRDAVGHADPHRLQRRHAGHPPRPHQASDRQLEGAAEPRVQGQGRHPQHPLDRHHGRGDGGGVDRRLQISRQGQHDEGRRSTCTMKVLTEAKKAGQFRAFWKDFNESVNLMASGETVIQSMWSPAVTAVRIEGHPLHLPAAERRLPLLGRGLRAVQEHQGHQEGRPRLRVRQLVPVRLGRRLPQPPGLLLGRAGDGQGQDGALRVGLLDGRRGRPRRTSRRPTARCSRRPAPSATAAPTRTAWATSPAGTPSWTRTTTWSEKVERVHRRVSGTSSPHVLASPSSRRRVFDRHGEGSGVGGSITATLFTSAPHPNPSPVERGGECRGRQRCRPHPSTERTMPGWAQALPLAAVFARVLHRAAAADRDGQLLELQRVRDHSRHHRAQLRGDLRGLRRAAVLG